VVDVVHPSIAAVATFEGIWDIEAFVQFGPPDVGAWGLGDEVGGLVGCGVANGPDIFAGNSETAAVADFQDEEILVAKVFGVDERR